MTAVKVQQYNYDQELASVREKVPVAVTLTGDPEVHNNNVRTKAHVFAIQIDSVWKEADAEIMIYIKRNPAAELLRYGDQITVAGGIQEPVAPMNPGEFDYKGWLRDQGIGYVCFARNDWTKTGEEYPSLLKRYALQLRNYFTARMKVAGLSGQELAVSEALLLGKSNEIDPNLLASYSASGTLHVLSVSGMHVALLFVVLLKLLAPLEKKRNGKLISYSIQFIVIWFYAFMTGMSPSVLRSVMMLSVIIFGNIIQRKGHLLNTLAASALILLVIDPLLIRNAGFLLSYAAVAGIVIGVPIIDPLLQPKNRITRAIWDITAVTIAAQLFTFPLGLYLFQQFPTWFLFTNLIIIPLSTICLYAGLFFLSVSWWTFGATIYAFVFGFLISVLNYIVAFTEYLPGAVVYTSKWSIAEVSILYLAIICVLISIAYRRKLFAVSAGVSVLSLAAIVITNNAEIANTSQLTIYHLQHGYAIGCREGNDGKIWISATTAENPEMLDYHVMPDFKNYGIQNPEVVTISHDSNQMLEVSGSKIWVGESSDKRDENIFVNYILIHEANAKDTTVLNVVSADSIILTGGIRRYERNTWKKIAERKKIPVIETKTSGAVIFPERNLLR
jgi:competence protein ComEC